MRNFEEIEILCRHIPVIISKIGETQSFIHKGSEISQFFQSNQLTSENLDKVKIAIQNNDVLPNITIPDKYKSLPNISTVNQTLQYFIRYLQLTENVLKQYETINNNENFKCYYLLTIQFCQLFVTFSKLVYFFSKNPICCKILLAFYTIDFQSMFDPNKRSSVSLTDINYIIKTAILCTYDLNNYLHGIFDNLKNYIDSLVSEIASSMTGIFNRITFETFSIFSLSSVDSTTFLPMDNIIMMNIELL